MKTEKRIEEQWRPVVGLEKTYRVSNMGNVKSIDRVVIKSHGVVAGIKGKMLRPAINFKGYYTVCLCQKSVCKTRTVHQLVAMAFLDHIPCGYEVVIDHKDDNPLNNQLDNLALTTQRNNTTRGKKGGSSKYVGVSWEKSRRKWKSVIYINGVHITLGRYDDELDARDAYQERLNTIKVSDLKNLTNK